MADIRRDAVDPSRRGRVHRIPDLNKIEDARGRDQDPTRLAPRVRAEGNGLRRPHPNPQGPRNQNPRARISPLIRPQEVGQHVPEIQHQQNGHEAGKQVRTHTLPKGWFAMHLRNDPPKEFVQLMPARQDKTTEGFTSPSRSRGRPVRKLVYAPGGGGGGGGGVTEIAALLATRALLAA